MNRETYDVGYLLQQNLVGDAAPKYSILMTPTGQLQSAAAYTEGKLQEDTYEFSPNPLTVGLANPLTLKNGPVQAIGLLSGALSQGGISVAGPRNLGDGAYIMDVHEGTALREIQEALQGL